MIMKRISALFDPFPGRTHEGRTLRCRKGTEGISYKVGMTVDHRLPPDCFHHLGSLAA